MGIVLLLLIPTILVYLIYRKVTAKNPVLNEFVYRFCGTLMLLCIALCALAHITDFDELNGLRMLWLLPLLPLSFPLNKKMWRTIGQIFQPGGLRVLGCLLLCANVTAYVYTWAFSSPSLTWSLWPVAIIVFVLALCHEVLFKIFSNEKVKHPTLALLALVNAIGIFSVMT